MAEESSGFAVKIFQMIAVTLISFTRLLYIGDYQFERDCRQNSELNLILKTNWLVSKVNGWLGTNLRILRENTALSDVVSTDAAQQKPLFSAIESTWYRTS